MKFIITLALSLTIGVTFAQTKPVGGKQFELKGRIINEIQLTPDCGIIAWATVIEFEIIEFSDPHYKTSTIGVIFTCPEGYGDNFFTVGATYRMTVEEQNQADFTWTIINKSVLDKYKLNERFLVVTTEKVPEKTVHYSPDKNFSLLITSSHLADVQGAWKYWLIADKDTTLLTSATTHDEFPPVFFWSKSSLQIIFEEQTYEDNNNMLEVYNLKDKKTEFETPGFIWGEGKSNFDQGRGLVFYFRQTGDTYGKFDLLCLNLETKQIKTLSSLATSGDPLTGAPEIESIDTVNRRLTLIFESRDGKSATRKIDY